MKYFFDNNISFRIAHSLKALFAVDSDQIEHISDLYAADPGDATWVSDLANDNAVWTVVTLDRRAHSHLLRATTIASAGLIVLNLNKHWNKPFRQQATNLIQRWADLDGLAKSSALGSVYTIMWKASGTPIKRIR